MSCSAMHSSAVALRSPAVMSMSISRPGRMVATSDARRISSSVSLPIALTTTTTSLPCRRVRATWSATWRMRSGSATEVPPNFWTTSVIGPRTLLALGWTTTQQSAPHLERVEELDLGGMQDGAQRPDVVAAHGQPPPVEVAALDDDRPQVPHHGLGVWHAAKG